MPDKKEVTPVIALREFFGFGEGKTLKDFHAEIKALSEQEKLELAELACKELGYTLKV